MANITYQQAREQYPDRWILFEALDTTIEGNRLIIPYLEVIGAYEDSRELWQQYTEVHRQDRQREIGFYHTSNPELVVEVRQRYRIA